MDSITARPERPDTPAARQLIEDLAALLASKGLVTDMALPDGSVWEAKACGWRS